ARDEGLVAGGDHLAVGGEQPPAPLAAAVLVGLEAGPHGPAADAAHGSTSVPWMVAISRKRALARSSAARRLRATIGHSARDPSATGSGRDRKSARLSSRRVGTRR